MSIILRRRGLWGFTPVTGAILRSLPESTYGSETVVQIAESGVFADYLVLKHNYEGSTGTLLLRRDVLSSARVWTSESPYDFVAYSASGIDTWLNDTFALNYDILSRIMSAPITCITDTSGTLSSVNRQIFLLSTKELGLSATYAEGSAIGYFASNAARIARLSGTAKTYHTRSTVTSNTRWQNDRVLSTGAKTTSFCANVSSVRPALVLPANTVVNANMTIT